jgi:hypothetical protein
MRFIGPEQRHDSTMRMRANYVWGLHWLRQCINARQALELLGHIDMPRDAALALLSKPPKTRKAKTMNITDLPPTAFNPFHRLALACSRLSSLAETAGLSFECADEETKQAACDTLDLIKELVSDINGLGPLPPGTHEPYVLRLERFAHRVLSLEEAYSTTPDLRDHARAALGMPRSEAHQPVVIEHLG